MKKLAVVLGVLALAVTAAQAALIPPGSLTATAEGEHEWYYGPEYAVNGAGLYMGTYPNEIHHGGHHSGHGNSTEQQWLSLEPTDWFKVDLGGLYSLDMIRVWNGSFRGTVVDDSLKDADIYYSSSPTDPGVPGGAGWTLWGAHEFVPNPGTGDWGKTEEIPMGGINAQWIGLDIKSNWGDYANWTAIGELQFEGSPAQEQVVVPEPATIALFGLGMLALWRRR